MLGIIADDFTGATDVAGYLVREGTPTVQFFGLPEPDAEVPEGVRAVVVAMKTRAIGPSEAVAQSLQALDWLLTTAHADHIYFKYCSTFDSTERGNIGPVAMALAAKLGESGILVAPSAPENGRTVYQGKLFVFDQLLSESPMRNHPVNPMRDSDLRRLLQAQGCLSVGVINESCISGGADKVAAKLGKDAPLLVVGDAITNADLDVLADGVARAGRRLTSGSAGLGAAVARRIREEPTEASWPDFPAGGAFVLSGSCSQATLRQIEDYRADHPSLRVDGLEEEDRMVAAAEAFLVEHRDEAPLVYSSAEPGEVRRVQERWGAEEAARKLESVIARVAKAGVAAGMRTVVVAGGETSGAVVQALGVKSIVIGREIAIGVPWCLSGGDEPIALALKSGNFGGPGFFREALMIADEQRRVAER